MMRSAHSVALPRGLSLGLAFGVSVWAFAPIAAADTINFLGNRKPQLGVTVLDEKLDVVEFKLPKVTQKQTVPSSEVADVVYDEPPTDYKDALESLEGAASKEDYKSVSEQFLALAPDLKSKPGLQAQALMNAAYAAERAGDRKKVGEIYDKIANEMSQSRYAPIAAFEKGRDLAIAGDAKGARAAFTKVKEMGERWSFMADLQLQILDEAANPTAALDVYKKIITQTGSKYPDVANLARLQVGRAMIAAKQYLEAETNFRSILDNRTASSRDIQAGAWNGLGAALASKEKATADDLKKALFAHLRVITQFDDVLDEQPEALYRAGKAFQKVQTTDSATRSKQLLTRCQKEFAGTEWAKKAAQG